ncbi:MAG: RNA-dependent DNA polymerase [Ktedonobacterales bacterium]|nr:RNA-dependent DNA polymerase [Ktedonobacterales bacterium]
MVKRAYDLYPQVCAFHNLVWAERTAARGKRGRPDIARFEYRLEDELLGLRDELRQQTYRPGPYRRYMVREPKARIISAAPYRDRVVHHALCRVIEPPFERRFIGDSYASRLGKGTHAALDRGTFFARRFPYVLRCDIEQFFPSVDHAILHDRLARVVGDADVLWLCDRILAGGTESPAPPVGQGVGGVGLPIGNQTSQFWANVYLDALDQFVKRDLRCPGYVRYVDDFLLFAPEKATLHRWKWEIIAFLATLRLSLHEAESAVFPVATGIPFLGFRVYPDHRRLRRRNAVAFARRHRALAIGYEAGAVSYDQLTASVQGWVAHAAHGDTYGLRRALLARTLAAPGAEVARAGQ